MNMHNKEASRRAFPMLIMFAVFGTLCVSSGGVHKDSQSRLFRMEDAHPTQERRVLNAVYDKYYLVKGDNDQKCTEPNGCDTVAAVKSEVHAVRCCSDSIQSWNQASGCSVWSESDIWSEGCQELSWDDANDFCASKGGRLCTKEEIETRCASGNGCEFDFRLIWSSTPFIQESTEHYASKGKGDSKSTKLVSNDNIYPVRCVSDSDRSNDGWSKRNFCSIWYESDVWTEGCVSRSWSEAETFCNNQGGRLPTLQEVESRCVRGSGCGYDNKLVWSSTSSETSQQSSSSSSSQQSSSSSSSQQSSSSSSSPLFESIKDLSGKTVPNSIRNDACHLTAIDVNDGRIQASCNDIKVASDVSIENPEISANSDGTLSISGTLVIYAFEMEVSGTRLVDGTWEIAKKVSAAFPDISIIEGFLVITDTAVSYADGIVTLAFSVEMTHQGQKFEVLAQITQINDKLVLETNLPEEGFPPICVTNRDASCVTFNSITLQAERENKKWSGGISVSAELGNLATVDGEFTYDSEDKEMGLLLSITKEGGFGLKDFVEALTGQSLNLGHNLAGEVIDVVNEAKLEAASVAVSSDPSAPREISASIKLFNTAFHTMIRVEGSDYLALFYATGEDVGDLKFDIGSFPVSEVISELINQDDLVIFSVASNEAIGKEISKVGSKEIEPFNVSPGLELLMHFGLTEGYKKNIGDATGADSLMIRVNRDGHEFSFEAEAKACSPGWRPFHNAPFLITQVSFYARKEARSVGFGFGAHIVTQDGPSFYGSIGVSSSPWKMEAAVAYTGEGYWNEPLGIEGLKISAFEIEFEFLIAPLPLPTRFKIIGAGCIGQEEGAEWCADISIFADVEEAVYFFSGRFDDLNLKQIAGAFDPNSIPTEVNDVLETFGFEELDLEFADAPLGAIADPPTLQRYDGTEVVVQGGYFQATVTGLQAGIIRADHASFFFERTPDAKVSVETAISLPKTQVRIPQLDWLNPEGGFTVTFLRPDSSDLLDAVVDFLEGNGDSTSTEHYASKGKGESTSTKLVSDDNIYPVRCVSDSDRSNDGWSKRDFCSIWYESDVWTEGCVSRSWSEAETFCNNQGGRLPTLKEIESKCVRGSGCEYDSKLVWSSTSKSSQTSTIRGNFDSDGPFFYLKAAVGEEPVIAFGAAVELYVLGTKVTASVTGFFNEGVLEASFSAKLEEVPIPNWMAAQDAFAGRLEGWIDVDGNVFDNSGHFVKNAVTGLGDKAEETKDWIEYNVNYYLGRRRLFDPSTMVRFGEIEVSWSGTIDADMLV